MIAIRWDCAEKMLEKLLDYYPAEAERQEVWDYAETNADGLCSGRQLELAAAWLQAAGFVDNMISRGPGTSTYSRLTPKGFLYLISRGYESPTINLEQLSEDWQILAK